MCLNTENAGGNVRRKIFMHLEPQIKFISKIYFYILILTSLLAFSLFFLSKTNNMK